MSEFASVYPPQGMNPMYKTKWVNALRSGKYQQGTKFLNNITDNTYCCLGVLCEILVAEGVLSKTEVDDTLYQPGGAVAVKVGRYRGDTNFDQETGLLNETASEITGLTVLNEFEDTEYIEDPIVTYTDPDGRKITQTLSSINDAGWHNFEAIADLIENQL